MKNEFSVGVTYLNTLHAQSDWRPLQHLHLQEKKNRKEKLESDVAMCRYVDGFCYPS